MRSATEVPTNDLVTLLREAIVHRVETGEKYADLLELNALAKVRKTLDAAAAGLEILGDHILDELGDLEPAEAEALRGALIGAITGLDLLGAPLPCIKREREKKRVAAAYSEVGALLAQHFPGGIVLDVRASGELPVLRCGPYRDSPGPWGVVKVNGRREVRALPDGSPVLAGSQEDGLVVRMTRAS